MKSINFFYFVFATSMVFGQSLKSEDLRYNYVKLPTNPLQPRVANYTSSLSSSSDEENAKIVAQYEKDVAQAEADYQREMNEYPLKVKAADEKYEKAMAEYNEKSLAKKILEKQLLNENTKPVKDYVPQPYKRNVSKPVMNTVYDYPSLASTYLKLDGFSKGSENALSYHVNMQGFEHSQPVVKNEVKKESKVVNGTATTADVTYYWVEFTYRNPMSVKVANASGQEIFYEAPAELSEFKTYKSTSSKNYPSTDYSSLYRTVEEKVLKDNLMYINHLVNDKIGYEITSRETSLDYVKSKGDEYADFNEAYNNAMIGFKSLTTNEETAKQKIKMAIDLWTKILGESDITNKKARIDKDITIAIYFNLVECHFAMRNVSEAETILSALERMDISNRDKKNKEKYVALFLDLAGRKTANGL